MRGRAVHATSGISRTFLIALVLFGVVLVSVVGYRVLQGLQGLPNGTQTSSHSTSVSNVIPTSQAKIDVHARSAGHSSAIGIVDYGIENQTGQLVPYKELLNGVVGAATVYSLDAYNASAAYPNFSALQLNVFLQINTTVGSREYWLQDVGTFSMTRGIFYGTSAVFNETLPNSGLSASHISGKGPSNDAIQSNRGRVWFGSQNALNEPYLLPFKFELLMSILNISQASVEVGFAYQILASGGSQPHSIVHFDIVTISTSNSIRAASMVVSGYSMTPSQTSCQQNSCIRHLGFFYDAELVWGGGAAGDKTTFTTMNSSLGLSYLLASGGASHPKFVYEFSGDTEEGTYNLQTSYGNGIFWVTVGTPNYNKIFMIP